MKGDPFLVFFWSLQPIQSTGQNHSIKLINPFIHVHRVDPVVYESVGGGPAPECEVTGVEYEEIDKLREPKKLPPAGDYELTQCVAYGPVNRDTT